MLGASDAEVKGCKETANILGQTGVEEIQEGSEPGAFWNAIGGKADYAKDPRDEVQQYANNIYKIISTRTPVFRVPSLNQDCLNAATPAVDSVLKKSAETGFRMI